MRALWGVLLLMACGVRYDSKTTKGVACDDVGNAVCEKLSACNFFPMANVSDCVASAVKGCCGDARICGTTVSNPNGAAECVNRVPGEDCSAFGTRGAPTLPGYCLQMF